MTFSSEIYTRGLDVGINILDGPDRWAYFNSRNWTSAVSTRKPRISDGLSEEDLNSISLGEKAVRRSPAHEKRQMKVPWLYGSWF